MSERRRNNPKEAAMVGHRLLSSAMRSSDNSDWPAHNLALPLQDFGLLVGRPPHTVPVVVFDDDVDRHGRTRIACDNMTYCTHCHVS